MKNNTIFELKKIRFNGNQISICLQNENGPCPLLAIANVLLLRKAIEINQSSISADELLQFVGSYISSIQVQSTDDQVIANFEQQISDALGSLPQLLEGLDVNVRFCKLTDFEYTSGLVIFDVIGVELIHGWLVPEIHPNYNIISKYSYNQSVEKIILMRTLVQENKLELTEEEKLLISEGTALEDWIFKECPGQFTFNGIVEMHSKIKEGQFAILFRNNHFNVIYKYQNQICQLVTDVGYANKSVVWEILNEVGGDTQLVGANFELIGGTPDLDFPMQNLSLNDEESLRLAQKMQDEEYAKEEERKSYELAVKLQEKEERRAKEEYYQPKQRKPKDHQKNLSQSAPSGRRKNSKESKKKDDDCVIS